jgi:hypothetical protein
MPLRPNLFQGTRPQLAHGTLGDRRIATFTSTHAAKILSQPGQWPTDLVTTAVLALSSDLSNLPAG